MSLPTYFFFILALPSLISCVFQNNDSNISNLTILIDNKTECQMYQKNCFVKITSKYLISFVNFKSNKSKIFEFNMWKKCSFNQTNTLPKDCLKFKKSIPTNRELYLLNIKPKLVGRAYLEVEYFIDDNYTRTKTRMIHSIVIKSPRRFIDVFQIFYISFVSFIVAIIMGILLDTDSLISIIKMPISVGIGFISQYLFMPLVSYSFY